MKYFIFLLAATFLLALAPWSCSLGPPSQHALADTIIPPIPPSRRIALPIGGNMRVITGSASWIANTLVTINDEDVFVIPINGIWVDSDTHMTQVRIRLRQFGSDRLRATLWETDANLNLTAISTATTQSAAGAQWLTLAGFARPTAPGHQWHLRLDHLGASMTHIHISLVEIAIEADAVSF